MSDISVKVAHKSDAEKTRPVVAKTLDKMSEKMGFNVVWDGDKASLDGNGIKQGTIEIDETNISVEINLAMMAKPMKGMIQKMITEAFEKRLG